VDGQDVLRTDAGTWARSGDGGQTWEVIAYQRVRPAPPPGGWRAPRSTPSGVWWSAAVEKGRPVLRHGEQVIDLPGASGDGITATLVGEQVLVFILENQKIVGGYQGDARGFQKVSGGGDQTISGEPIVLPDGRVLIADSKGQWRLSADRGTTWTSAGGTMPAVGSLHMTTRGYVAYNLFGVGWVATSRDGVAWQKLAIR
jgi:hypothetical protein